MPGDSTVPRGGQQSAQKWLDLAGRAVQEEDYDLLVKSIAGLAKQSGEDLLWLEEILYFADCLTKSEDHLVRAMEAFLFVADRTSCADDRWKRVKKSMIAAAVGSNDPELCMEVFQYIRDREPKTEGGQWDMFVLDFLLPFDLSDMMDLQSLWKMVQEHHALSAEEEFCRVISRAMRQAGQADLADEMGLSRAGKKVVPLRPKKAGFSSGLRAQSLLRLVA